MHKKRTYLVSGNELSWVLQNIQAANLRHDLSTEMDFEKNGSLIRLMLEGDYKKMDDYIKFLNSDAKGNSIDVVKRIFY